MSVSADQSDMWGDPGTADAVTKINLFLVPVPEAAARPIFIFSLCTGVYRSTKRGTPVPLIY